MTATVKADLPSRACLTEYSLPGQCAVQRQGSPEGCQLRPLDADTAKLQTPLGVDVSQVPVGEVVGFGLSIVEDLGLGFRLGCRVQD